MIKIANTFFTDGTFMAVGNVDDGTYTVVVYELIDQQDSKVLLYSLTSGEYYFYQKGKLTLADYDARLEFFETSSFLNFDGYTTGRVVEVVGDKEIYHQYDIEADMDEAYSPNGVIIEGLTYYLQVLEYGDPVTQLVEVWALKESTFQCRIRYGRLEIEINPNEWVNWVCDDNLVEHLISNYKI